MTIVEVTLDRPKVGTGFSVIFRFCRLRLFWFAWNFSAEIFTPYRLFPFGIRSLFLFFLLYHQLLGIWTHHLFGWSILPLLWFSEDKCLMHLNFPNLPGLLSRYLLSIIPRDQLKALVKLSCQIDEVLIGYALRSGDVRSVLWRELLALWMVLRIVIRMAFSHLPRGLGHFEDSNCIP